MENNDFKHVEVAGAARPGAPFARAQRLPVTASRRFLRRLAWGELALAALLLSELGQAPMAWLLVLALLLHTPLLAREWAREARSFRAAWLAPDGSWWLEGHCGGLQRAYPGGARLVTDGCLLLPLRRARWRAGPTLCLMRDNLAAEDFRRLRVRLLWGGAG